MSEQHAKQPNPSQVLVDVVILTGGKSTRMGRDKALLRVDGCTLIEHHLQNFSAKANKLWLVGGELQDIKLPDNAEYLADYLSQQEGPLSGLLAAFLASSADFLWVIACDSYGVSWPVYVAMQQQLEQAGADIACLKLDARVQPLLSVMRRTLLEGLQVYVDDGGRAVMPWLSQAQQIECIAPEVHSFQCNINTPEQYQQLLLNVGKS